MGKGFKWMVVILGGMVALFVAAVLILPAVINVQRFRPQIEQRLSEMAGAPVALKGDLELSLFPWVGVKVGDLKVGNPPGFGAPEMLSVASFEVRVKLLPLLSRDVQVKRLILNRPHLVLERSRDGRANWETLGKRDPQAPGRERPATADEPGRGLPIMALAVAELALKDGSVLWLDQKAGVRREVSGISLRMEDVTLERPIQFTFSADLEGRPLVLKGRVGPLGKDPGQAAIPLDLVVNAFEEAVVNLTGKVEAPAKRAAFDLLLKVDPFSPRKLAAAAGMDFPLKTADPQALNRLAFKARVKGSPTQLAVSGGVLEVDRSRFDLTLEAKDFSRPVLAFDLRSDRLELDGYLPPEAPAGGAKSRPGPAEKKKTDYGPLRRLVVSGRIQVGELVVRDVEVRDLQLQIKGENGVLELAPLNLKVYDGEVAAKAAVDVRAERPRTRATLRMKGVQAGPLLSRLLKKDLIEGLMASEVNISAVGDEVGEIKASLNGGGEFVFNDGAVKGIDLPGMLRNVKAAFGLAKKSEERPKTDFSELRSRFTIENGVVNTPSTTMLSPVLRVTATGWADLVKETLEFRVEPKFVGTLKGQGDTVERTGFAVPVVVAGSFSSPSFRPDLEGLLKQKLPTELPDTAELKKGLKQQEAQAKELLKKTVEGGLGGLTGKTTAEEQKAPEGAPKPPSPEDQAKGLLKTLPFGKD